VRVELSIVDDYAIHYFEVLKQDRERIDAELGGETTWFSRPGQKTCRIYVRRDVVDLRDESEWPGLHEWMLKNLETFTSVFRNRIRALSAPDESPE